MRAELLRALERALDAEEPAAVVTVLAGPGAGRQMLVTAGARAGSLGAPELDDTGVEAALAALAGGESRRVEIFGLDAFVDVHPAPPHLVIVGAVHVAIPLVSLARMLGYRTSVVDPRASFATAERFGHADEILVDWPGEALARLGIRESTCVAVLAHDLKIELPAILAAFAAGARYVGVLGSRKTHERRLAALREAGATDEQLARLRAPIGLDLGARTPEEIALSIAAELVREKWGHSSFPVNGKR